MFTGIITGCEAITRITEKNGIHTVTIKTPDSWGDIQVGESITVDGVCSTVAGIPDGSFTVDYMPETLRQTTLGRKQEGDRMNLERSMKLHDLVSGHLVYGHVDCTGTVNKVARDGDSFIITVEHDPRYDQLLVQKGSVTINGISLTVVSPSEGIFQVAIIPHTWENTNLQSLRHGDSVNLEFDIIAKYIISQLNHYGGQTINPEARHPDAE